MTPRSIRRAAERKALKTDQKAARNAVQTESPVKVAATTKAISPPNTPPIELTPNSPLVPPRKPAAPPPPATTPATASPSTSTQAALSKSSLDAFAAEWQAVTATETDFVNRMAIHSWLRDRATRLQDHVLAGGMNGLQDFKHFEIYARYHTTHARAFNKAFADLMRLRLFQLRQKKEEALLERRTQEIQIRFESQKRKVEEHAAKMEAKIQRKSCLAQAAPVEITLAQAAT